MNNTLLVFSELRQHLAEAPCLSIRQPWAELILLGRKKVELRHWSTRHRGWIWLHTGRTVDEVACNRFRMSALFAGGFVGAFRLRDVVDLSEELWEVWRSSHGDAGAYQPNSFGWVIDQALRLEQPIAASGNRGLYRVEGSTLSRLLRERFLGEV